MAGALEGLYANRLEDFAPVLARHFQEAGDDERTLRYASSAADHAARLYANAEAVTQYDVAIEAARRLGANDELVGHLYPSRGRALELSGRFDEAEANYEDMRATAEGVRGPGRRARRDDVAHDAVRDPDAEVRRRGGRRASQEAVRLARELGDKRAEAKAQWNLMNLNVFGGGDCQRGREAGERSLALAREVGAREQIAFVLNDLWRPYMSTGDLSAARGTWSRRCRSGATWGTSRW